MGFTVRPSKWEIEHADFIANGQHFQSLTGRLPTTTPWRRLEHRFDLNPKRFAKNHPNVAAMIAVSKDTDQRVVQPPSYNGETCQFSQTGIVVDPTPPAPIVPVQAVPEPSSWGLAAIAALVLTVLATWRVSYGKLKMAVVDLALDDDTVVIRL